MSDGFMNWIVEKHKQLCPCQKAAFLCLLKGDSHSLLQHICRQLPKWGACYCVESRLPGTYNIPLDHTDDPPLILKTFKDKFARELAEIAQ